MVIKQVEKMYKNGRPMFGVWWFDRAGVFNGVQWIHSRYERLPEEVREFIKKAGADPYRMRWVICGEAGEGQRVIYYA